MITDFMKKSLIVSEEMLDHNNLFLRINNTPLPFKYNYTYNKI